MSPARLRRAALLVATLAAVPALAGTPGGDLRPWVGFGEGLADRERTEVVVHGYLRTRGELLGNLDLDHGLTPSGAPLFPIPAADPSGQLLSHADMRGRVDLSLYAPGPSVVVRARVDALDNLALGSAPEGPPSATTGQRTPAQPLALRRLWGEVLLPFGVLAAGRMGAHWGLGLLSHGGDCLDCDSNTVSDRIAFATPLGGLVWALAYDFSASGPVTPRRVTTRSLDLDPADDVRTVTLAVMDYAGPAARARRSAAGRWTFESGAVLTWRRQRWDLPSSWLPLEGERPTPGPAQAVERDFTAMGGDLWLRLESQRVLVEAEAAVLHARYGESSLVPGVALAQPIEGLQIGAALQSRFGRRDEGVSGGLDLVFASGDPAPGFGVVQPAVATPPKPGDLDGTQVAPPGDSRIDNFRAHSDFRVDRILFREILGTITDAWVLRPHLRWRGHPVGAGRLELELAAVLSFAHEANSTPSGERPLGFELDPTLTWHSRDGFSVQVQGAWLRPLAGLDNGVTGQSARPAWMTRCLLGWRF